MVLTVAPVVGLIRVAKLAEVGCDLMAQMVFGRHRMRHTTRA
jgi:hypothetical protein